MQTLRVIIYTRVSTDDQATEGTGLETQEIENRRYAERIGATVVAVCTDPGISGTIYPRPGLEDALTMIEGGAADGLLAYNASRLARKTGIALMVWERIQVTGARLFLHDTGEVTEATEMMFTMSGAFAQHEWREICRRMKAGHRRRAEAGSMPCRTQAPLGYRIIRNGEVGPNGEPPGAYVIEPEEAEIVREIFQRYAAGDSMRAVCRWLQDSGFPIPRPASSCKPVPYWQPTTVKRILQNSVYIGRAVWGVRETKKINGKRRRVLTANEKQVVIPAPAIVDLNTWQHCQEILPANKGGCRNDRKHVFAGLMVCPVCGRKSIAIKNTFSWKRKGTGETKRNHLVYYACKYYCPGSNSAKVVCCETLHGQRVVQEAVRVTLELLEKYPDFLSAAYAAYRCRKASGYSEAEHKALLTEGKALETREEATAKAQIDALMKGRSTAVYDKLLADIHAERKALDARLSAMDAAKAQAEPDEVPDLADLAKSAAADMLEVLQSETMTPAEKNARLSRVITEIRPTEEGYRIIYKPLRIGSNCVPVAFTLPMAALTATRW